MLENKTIYEILREAANSSYLSVSYSSIIDNLNGSYTAAVDDVTNLMLYDYVSFIDSVQFTDDYKITSIDYDNNTIVFKDEAGKTTESGTLRMSAPYFHFEKWIGATQINLDKDRSPIARFKKFPLVLLLLDVESERINRSLVEYNQLKIYLIEKTVSNEKLPNNDIVTEWREQNTFAKRLRPLEKRFIDNLQSHVLTKGNTNNNNKDIYTKRVERFFLGTSDKNQNKLNEFVDAIELTIDNLRVTDILNACTN